MISKAVDGIICGLGADGYIIALNGIKKIIDNDTEFLNKTLKELHPADSADLIENLVPENRSKLIELVGFSLDPEIFTELNESIQTEVFILLSTESIANILKHLESDNALKIIEWLIKQKEVEDILYPAFEKFNGYKIWKRDFLGASGLFGITLKPIQKKTINLSLIHI